MITADSSDGSFCIFSRKVSCILFIASKLSSIDLLLNLEELFLKFILEIHETLENISF
jgi:hypothetical protein